MKRTMKENRTKVAIINATTNTLCIENVSEDDLKNYNGDIGSYIEDNYNTSNCNWQVITSICYFPTPDFHGNPIYLNEIVDEQYV